MIIAVSEALRSIANETEFRVTATTLQGAYDELRKIAPALWDCIFAQDGSLKPFVAAFINGNEVIDNWKTSNLSVSDAQVIELIVVTAGG